jgi:hypothetical protein
MRAQVKDGGEMRSNRNFGTVGLLIHGTEPGWRRWIGVLGWVGEKQWQAI